MFFSPFYSEFLCVFGRANKRTKGQAEKEDEMRGLESKPTIYSILLGENYINNI